MEVRNIEVEVVHARIQLLKCLNNMCIVEAKTEFCHFNFTAESQARLGSTWGTDSWHAQADTLGNLPPTTALIVWWRICFHWASSCVSLAHSWHHMGGLPHKCWSEKDRIKVFSVVMSGALAHQWSKAGRRDWRGNITILPFFSKESYIYYSVGIMYWCIHSPNLKELEAFPPLRQLSLPQSGTV